MLVYRLILGSRHTTEKLRYICSPFTCHSMCGSIKRGWEWLLEGLSLSLGGGAAVTSVRSRRSHRTRRRVLRSSWFFLRFLTWFLTSQRRNNPLVSHSIYIYIRGFIILEIYTTECLCLSVLQEVMWNASMENRRLIFNSESNKWMHHVENSRYRNMYFLFYVYIPALTVNPVIIIDFIFTRD